jgi:4-aminobutyrate aminotransferase-like enzyme
MESILALNAFDKNATTDLGAALQARVAKRVKLFGSASVLFYDRPLEIVRGEGCWLFDADGVAYLDAYNNVPSVGHCHPRVVAAATRQLGQLNISNRYLHSGTIDYAERLLSTLPSDLSNITFTCTGSESNDLALQLAAQYTGGDGIIITQAAYHGNTALTSQVSPSAFTQVTATARIRTVPAPDSYRVPAAGMSQSFAGHVAEAIADLQRHGIKFCALLVDSIFSSDGIYADPPGFLRAAIELVHRANGLFIADEVQSGFGRTGTHLWGFERHGVQPDIVTMGKPMGNGFPIGAVVTRPEILDAFCQRVGYFNTFAGSPVAAAAGQAVLEVIEQEGLTANARNVGDYLRQRLRELANRHAVIADVRGAGLFIGVELAEGPEHSPPPASITAVTSAVINALRERQVLIGAAGRFGNVLKLRPPLCFSMANADQLIAALDDALSEVA